MWSVVSTPNGGEGLPKMSRFGNLYSQRSTACGSVMHCGHVVSAAGSNNLAYALSSGVCSDRRRARRRASARCEVAMQSAFQEKFSYAMTVRGLLGGGSVMVRRVRAFTVANQMGRGGVSVVAVTAFTSSSVPLWSGPFLLSSR